MGRNPAIQTFCAHIVSAGVMKKKSVVQKLDADVVSVWAIWAGLVLIDAGSVFGLNMWLINAQLRRSGGLKNMMSKWIGYLSLTLYFLRCLIRCHSCITQ
jgi:hypothetical protein